MTEQTKLKISYALRNKKKTATHSHLIAVSLKGKKKKPQHKKAISESMKRYWEKRHKTLIYQGDKTCKFTNNN